MYQPWLHSNWRAGLLAALPMLLVGVVGLTLIGLFFVSEEGWHWRWLGYALAPIGLLIGGWQLYLATVPRMAYEQGELLLYLPPPDPLRVPIEHVECFFIGQGPSLLPDPQGEEAQAANIIVRLSERATDWHRCPVPPLLAQWCDGYITLRGAFCESFDGDLVNDLNRRLAEVHRRQRTEVASSP